MKLILLTLLLAGCASSSKTIRNGLTRSSIQKQIQRRLGEIKSCYHDALLKTPGARGKITVGFRVETGGSVSRLDVKEDTLKVDGLSDCIVDRMKSWAFPKAEWPTDVAAYPFHLNPTN